MQLFALSGSIALRKRGTNGIWAGLYEPPRLQAAPKNGEELAPAIVHKLSHKDLKCHFWAVDEEVLDEPITYYTKDRDCRFRHANNYCQSC
jgi:hypothetical protein